MNGVYLRALAAGGVRRRARSRWLRERGIEWPEERVRATVPLVQEKIESSRPVPRTSSASCSSRSSAGRRRPGRRAARRPRRSPRSSRGRRPDRGRRSAALAEGLGLKPRQAFQPIRIAVTGSKVSPGLFESLELLGRDESLARLCAPGDAGGPAVERRWNAPGRPERGAGRPLAEHSRPERPTAYS